MTVERLSAQVYGIKPDPMLQSESIALESADMSKHDEAKYQRDGIHICCSGEVSSKGHRLTGYSCDEKGNHMRSLPRIKWRDSVHEFHAVRTYH